MKNKNKSLILVIIWIIIGLYFGAGAYTEEVNYSALIEAKSKPTKPEPNGFKSTEGTWYKNAAHWRAEDNLLSDRNTFSIFHMVSASVQPFIAFFAFSLIGACSRLIRASFLNIKTLSINEVVQTPVICIVIAILIFTLKYLSPSLADENREMMYFFFLSLAAGLFTRDFFKYIGPRINPFSKKDEPDPNTPI